MNKFIPAEAFLPGEYLQDELDVRGWSQNDFAAIIGRDRKTISQIISGKAQITIETAKLLEQALGMDAQYWMNLETQYRLATAPSIDSESSNVAIKARLYEKFPVSQMIQRGWLEPSEDVALLQTRLFQFYKIGSIEEEPSLSHAARKKEEAKKTPVQNAWLFRTYELATAMSTQGYTESKLDKAIEKLKALMHAPEEIRHVPAILQEAGIRFVIVEALPGSKIDGACYWLDGKSPVVALSMRYDRIDNFWFTLFHELRHVKHGHGKSEVILDTEKEQSDSSVETPTREAEEALVNGEAAEDLVPQKQLDDFIARVRPMFTRNGIVGFANRIQVHPGIIVGQLHRRPNAIGWGDHRRFLVKVRSVVTSTAWCDGWGNTPRIRKPQ